MMIEIIKEYASLFKHTDPVTCAVWCGLAVFLILFWGGIAWLFF